MFMKNGIAFWADLLRWITVARIGAWHKNIQIPTSLVALWIAASFFVLAQDWKADIQKKLQSEYALTQPTDAQDDIVTAGAVLVLKTGKVMMPPVSNSNANVFQNLYKDGKISQNVVGRFSKFPKSWPIPGASAAPSGPDQRTFVPGEKMWVTKITVRDDAIVFGLFTDAFSEVRYHADLTFKFPKGWTPTTQQAEELVAQVFKVQPAEDEKKGEASASTSAPAPAPAAAPAAPLPPVTPPPAPTDQPTGSADSPSLPPVAPPPPPTDQPLPAPTTQEIDLTGKTAEQVIAALGKPEKSAKVGAKQILYYKDMKVTLTNGKVTGVD